MPRWSVNIKNGSKRMAGSLAPQRPSNATATPIARSGSAGCRAISAGTSCAIPGPGPGSPRPPARAFSHLCRLARIRRPGSGHSPLRQFVEHGRRSAGRCARESHSRRSHRYSRRSRRALRTAAQSLRASPRADSSLLPRLPPSDRASRNRLPADRCDRRPARQRAGGRHKTWSGFPAASAVLPRDSIRLPSCLRPVASRDRSPSVRPTSRPS